MLNELVTNKSMKIAKDDQKKLCKKWTWQNYTDIIWIGNKEPLVTVA